MKKAGIVFLSLITAFSFLAGQDTGSAQQNLTIEEVYLQRRQTVEAFTRLAQANDSDTRLIVINELERMVDEGKLTLQDEDYIAILDYLASDGNTIIARENNRKVHDYPEIRMLACRLLTKIKGEKSQRILRTVVINDEEPAVLSEAVYGLGVIGEDKDGKTSSLISNLLTKWDILGPDNNLAYAALLAIEKLAKQNNGIFDPEVLRSVIRINLPGSPYVTEVRQKAMEVFSLLRQYM